MNEERVIEQVMSDRKSEKCGESNKYITADTRPY